MAFRKTKTSTEAQILHAARQVAKGKRVAEICKELDISPSTYTRLQRRFHVKELRRKRGRVYSMRDLCEEMDLSRRGVALYIEAGLLEPATAFGAGAHYREEHLVRVHLLVLLKRAGIRRADMHRILARLTPEREKAIVRSACKLAWGSPRIRAWLEKLHEGIARP
jgi:DNA-binding transcriptional MerR regulator